jgi:hypothetical protein
MELNVFKGTALIVAGFGPGLTNGSLMVQLIEMESTRAQLKAEGWDGM